MLSYGEKQGTGTAGAAPNMAAALRGRPPREEFPRARLKPVPGEGSAEPRCCSRCW